MNLSQIKKIAVIGSGIMGHGIGQTFALGGHVVTLNDISDELLKKLSSRYEQTSTLLSSSGSQRLKLQKRPSRG